jgi:hypothetical protein
MKPYLKNTLHKKKKERLVEWFKALNSSPSTTKKKVTKIDNNKITIS